MQTKQLVVAKADETNVKIDAMNVKLDKTSAEIISLGQEMDEEGSQVRSQVRAVVEDVAYIKEQQKIITNRAPPIELQSEIIPEKEGQEVNMINETTTESSNETKVGKIYTIDTTNTILINRYLHKLSLY